MAVIKAKVARGGSAGFLVHYIGNPNKTADCKFVTGIHCSPDSNNAALDMEQIKKIYNKERGIRGYHIIQSFLPGEVEPELAMKLVFKWQRNYGEIDFKYMLEHMLIENMFIITYL